MPLLCDIKFNNKVLGKTSEFCDLGLITRNKLSWNSHMDKIFSKANLAFLIG